MSESSINFKPEAEWQWYSCMFDLKKVLKNKEVFSSLAPSIVLNHPNFTEDNAVEVDVKCHVILEKNFIFSEEVGWNWHKSWNIPNITTKIEITDPLTNEKFLAPNKFFVEVIVTKAEFNEIQTFHLTDIGVKGNNKYQLHKNECTFSGLKFVPTSYNHEGARFHLVVIFYMIKNNDDFHHVLEAKISPPIFVDSRKTARENHKNLKNKEIYSFIEPFHPEKLSKILIKRENKKNFGFEEEIENSINGLNHYFSAPNIRNKVKHPLFLAIKFSNIVHLYFNSKIISKDQDEKAFIENIQKHLVDIYTSKDKKATSKEKLLILHVQDLYKDNQEANKKALEFFELVETNSLQVISDQKNLPAHFFEVEIKDSLITSYQSVYPKLILDKRLKGISNLLSNGKFFFSEFEEKNDDLLNEESKNEMSDESESFEGLLKLEDESSIPSFSRKAKKKVKLSKNAQDEVNLAGPIKVEIDLNSNFAQLNKQLKDEKKIKIEDNKPQTKPKNLKDQENSKDSDKSNLKIEAIATEIQQKPRPHNSFADFVKMESSLRENISNNNNFNFNNNNFNNNDSNNNNNNNNNNPSLSMNQNVRPPINMMPFPPNGNGMMLGNPNPFPLISGLSDRQKNIPILPQPPMNYYNYMEPALSNPYLFQEYMKLYLENMRKAYQNNFL